MAKKRTVADADAEIAALKAQLAAASGAAAEVADVQRFPSVMYHKIKVSEKYPHGYQARRVQATDDKGNLDVGKCEAEVATLEQAGWVHSPADLSA